MDAKLCLSFKLQRISRISQGKSVSYTIYKYQLLLFVFCFLRGEGKSTTGD